MFKINFKLNYKKFKKKIIKDTKMKNNFLISKIDWILKKNNNFWLNLNIKYFWKYNTLIFIIKK
jgi:hypothetical protein